MHTEVAAQELRNTPGILYAMAYIVSCGVYIFTDTRKKKGWKIVLRQLGLCLVLLLFMIVTDGVRIFWFFPCMVMIFLLLCRIIAVSCDRGVRDSFYYGIHVFAFGEFLASLEWQLYYYMVTSLEISFHVWSMLAAALAVNLLLGGMFCFLLQYVNKGDFRVHVNRKQLLVAGALLLIFYSISNVNYIDVSTPFSTKFTMDIFIIRTLVDFAGLGILTAYHIMLKDVGMREEMGHIEAMLQLQYHNYQISQESIDLVNQKYHDLKHQIAFLRTEVNAGEKLQYLDQLEEDIRLYETSNKTGNKVLDAILTTKSIQCQKLGIGFTCVADGHVLDFMNPMDISSLFGNALDNAMEAASKVLDPQKRLIHVLVSKEKGFLRIKVENSYEGTVEMRGGLPKTTKADRRMHGFGVKSIKHTAKMYSGSVTINAKNGWFELRMLIPIAAVHSESSYLPR